MEEYEKKLDLTGMLLLRLELLKHLPSTIIYKGGGIDEIVAADISIYATKEQYFNFINSEKIKQFYSKPYTTLKTRDIECIQVILKEELEIYKKNCLNIKSLMANVIDPHAVISLFGKYDLSVIESEETKDFLKTEFEISDEEYDYLCADSYCKLLEFTLGLDPDNFRFGFTKCDQDETIKMTREKIKKYLPKLSDQHRLELELKIN